MTRPSEPSWPGICSVLYVVNSTLRASGTTDPVQTSPATDDTSRKSEETPSPLSRDAAFLLAGFKAKGLTRTLCISLAKKRSQVHILKPPIMDSVPAYYEIKMKPKSGTGEAAGTAQTNTNQGDYGGATILGCVIL
ncbi:hypothetical protein LX36DRAFT_671246 [Colletotrichum falcatum]|nr:hypothetical protein LX36DRAFT_671246 [Colletotrichum falcatum]